MNGLLSQRMPESAYFKREDKNELIKKLLKYDIISFDIFDTLILRKVLNPTDVFTLVGTKLNIPNYKEIRIKAEADARKKYSHSDLVVKHGIKGKNQEISIDDIMAEIPSKIKVDRNLLKITEFEVENKVCYANPYLKYVFDELIKNNKKIIIISDMYWTYDYISKLLKNVGYDNYYKLYVSSMYLKNKGTASLIRVVGEENDCSNMIHIGDNYNSDIVQFEQFGISTYYYRSDIALAKETLPDIDSSLIPNSLYMALTSHFMHSTDHPYSIEYEHGFKCAGPIVYGFNKKIHEYYKTNKIDKVLFLARDMDIFYKTYKIMYPKDKIEYTVVSRMAMWIFKIKNDFESFIENFFKNKANLGIYTIEQALIDTDMNFLIDKFSEININEKLTIENYDAVYDFLLRNKRIIIKHFNPSILVGQEYFKNIVGSSKNILAVDLGWNGSIVIEMRKLFNKMFDDVDLKGYFIGLNDNPTTNKLLDEGIFSSYLFNYQKNKEASVANKTIYGDMIVKLFEATFSSFDGTLLKYEYDFDHNIIFKKGVVNSTKEYTQRLHNGVLDYIEKGSIVFEEFNCELDDLNVFKLSLYYFSNFQYCYRIMKNIKEWALSLPNFHGEGTLTTLGKLMKERKLL